jgi:hypothetical protein
VASFSIADVDIAVNAWRIEMLMFIHMLIFTSGFVTSCKVLSCLMMVWLQTVWWWIWTLKSHLVGSVKG